MIKAVILDLDDTLCLTEEACFRMENEVLARMGRPSIPRELHRRTWGRPLFSVITERSPGIDVQAFRAAYNPIIKRYTDSGQFDKIPDENLDAIDRLIALGKKVLVLTSREHNEMEHLLDKSHALGSRIETFYYKDNMQYHKPDPRAFTHIEAEHGWKPDECVYVGDSVSDAIAAKQAGLYFIASLQSGLRTREDFAAQGVDAFIDTFPEVVEAVQALDALNS